MAKSCFLCGIGGSGMSALAQMLLAQGWQVSGSDRSRDKGDTPEKFEAIEAQGIKLYPQNGTGLAAGMDMLVVSSAVENTIPDVKAAKDLDIPVRKRAEVLADLLNSAPLSIAVGGTSGKSTVTAMTGWILDKTGKNPTIVNGAVMMGFHDRAGLGNAVIGGADVFVAEVDESDGSIAYFKPSVAVLTNISLDHKPLPELRGLFNNYLKEAKQNVVINLDDPESAALAATDRRALTFALDNRTARFQAHDIKPLDDGVAFEVLDKARMESAAVRLHVPGRHNVANALAAIAAASVAGVPLKSAAAALGEYRGTRRRFEIMGAKAGVTVIDDFAHNPDKIAATLQTLHEKPGRVWIVFQPHGFGPTKLMRAGLTETFGKALNDNDVLVMPEIYYAGGTTTKDISSADIVRDVAAAGKQAQFIASRNDIPSYLASHVKPGDRVIVMGARDDTLPAFARSILAAIPG